MGAFDHLNGPQCGAFERHFGPGRGNLNNNFQKSQMPGGLPGMDVEASIRPIHNKIQIITVGNQLYP